MRVNQNCPECKVRWSCSLESDGPSFKPCEKHRKEWEAEMANLRVWKYEQVDLREDVKLGLPEDWAAFIYKVTAGEEEGKRYSGTPWYCTILHNAKTKQTIEFCNCPEGWSRAPLAVLNAVPHLCKHTENLMEFLRQKGLKGK